MPNKAHCRRELAREIRSGDAFIRNARVIVNVLREQACSYSAKALTEITMAYN